MQSFQYILCLNLICLSAFAYGQNESNAITFKKNTSYKEHIIQHDQIEISIPVGWKLYSETETRTILEMINQHSEYTVNFDYYLDLDTGQDYPNINIIIRKSDDFKRISFKEVKDYFKEIHEVATEKIMDGARNLITNHVDKEFLVDEINNRFFIILEGTVANVGTVRSNGAVILLDEYLININFANTLDTYEQYESALMIMVNSVRRKK